MSLAVLLSRLEGVREWGRGWRTDCPNGHSKARGSLSITQAEDGRVLLHCFACGDALGIVSAIGLELADLFPERVRDLSPEARKTDREAFKRSAWGAALGVLGREATVASIAAHDMAAGIVLDDADRARLCLAVERIDRAREVLL